MSVSRFSCKMFYDLILVWVSGIITSSFSNNNCISLAMKISQLKIRSSLTLLPIGCYGMEGLRSIFFDFTMRKLGNLFLSLPLPKHLQAAAKSEHLAFYLHYPSLMILIVPLYLYSLVFLNSCLDLFLCWIDFILMSLAGYVSTIFFILSCFLLVGFIGYAAYLHIYQGRMVDKFYFGYPINAVLDLKLVSVFFIWNWLFFSFC